MRILYMLLFCFLLMVGCSRSNGGQQHGTLPEALKEQALDLGNFKQHTIMLINEVGIVSMYLPDEMDTFFTYADYGQYHCGETKQYRFADKAFDPECGMDYSYSEPSDSMYQLTILQTYNPDCESYTDIDNKLLKSMQADKTHQYSMIEVKGKKIIVGIMDTVENDMHIAEVKAVTNAQGRKLRFVFQCYRQSAGNFVHDAITSIKTIEVKPPAGSQ